MRKPSVGIIFLTVFIDLVGFGIVIPLLPIYAKNFHASGFLIGALMSTFSLMQFFFAPRLGRLSDRIGRRPVLLTSTAGAALSYLVFAYGSTLAGHTALVVLFLSRAVAGICGANIGVAQAYIADITPHAERSKRMGLIGMAFGLGFILGPPLGGNARLYLGPAGPGFVAAGLCAANLLLAWRILPESRKPGSEHAAQRPHWDQWLHTMGLPKIGLLISVFFLATFCFTCFETTLGLLIFKKFSIDSESAKGINLVANLFMYAGLVGALAQGATGRLVKKLGEPKLIALSLFLVAVSLSRLPYARGWPEIYVLLAILGIGSSLTRPPVFGMISQLTNAHEQGVTIGVAQGAGALARIAGPIFASTLFARVPTVPYVVCAVLASLTGFLAWVQLSKDYEPALAVSAPKAEA